MYLTQHGYERAKERYIIPYWIHKKCANDFLVGLINQSSIKQVFNYGEFQKVILPKFKAYI
jgi:hypothetical protein